MPKRDPGDRLVEQYLDTLRAHLQSLPEDRRRHVLEDVGAHIAEARHHLAKGDEAGLRNVLERLGQPADIARAAGADPGVRPRWQDALVPWALLLGGFVFMVGWLVGLVWLWSSDVWSARDKLLGTFILPGGLFGVYLTFGLALHAASSVAPAGGSTMPGVAVSVPAILMIVLPILVAIYLERVRRRVLAGLPRSRWG